MLLDELESLGFKQVGEFFIEEDNFNFKLTGSYASGVYLFVANGLVKYVGMTEQDLFRRMYGYKNPGASQQTNKRIKRLLERELKDGGKVSISYIPSSSIVSQEATVSSGNHHKTTAVQPKLLERFMIAWLHPEWNAD